MKRALFVFGLVGTFFFASCDSRDRNEPITSEAEIYEDRYDTRDQYGYSTDMNGTIDGYQGTTWDNQDNMTGTGNVNQPVGVNDNTYATNRSIGTQGTLGSTNSGQYICLDSTLVGDSGY